MNNSDANLKRTPLDKYFKDLLSKDEERKLSIILNSLETGRDQVLITPVGERVGPDVLFDEWMKIFNSNRSKMNDALIEIEESQISKFGPRSIAKPFKDIEETVLSSFKPATYNCEHLSSLPTRSSDCFKLRPLSFNNTLRYVKKSTNSGLPMLAKKGRVLDEYSFNDIMSGYNRNYPCVPFIRTQENEKTRLVQGYPISDIIEEIRFFRPLFEYYRKLPCYAAMNGPEQVNTAMTKLLSEAVRLGQFCMSGDIEHFDVDFKVPLQAKCFDEMASLLQPAHLADFRSVEWRFGHKGLVLPDYVIEGPHGIPSGSQFTNLVGSIGNRKICNQPTELMQALGDDFVTISHNPDEIFKRYEDCGLSLNKSKTGVHDNHFVYLQNLFHPDYMEDGEIKGVYPTIRSLERLVFTGGFSDFNVFNLTGKDFFAIRSLSILENCKYHPLFEEFVRFWLKYDKYKIPTQQSIIEFAKMLDETTGSLGTMNQYGSDVRGILSWRSYQIALRMR